MGKYLYRLLRKIPGAGVRKCVGLLARAFAKTVETMLGVKVLGGSVGYGEGARVG